MRAGAEDAMNPLITAALAFVLACGTLAVPAGVLAGTAEPRIGQDDHILSGVIVVCPSEGRRQLGHAHNNEPPLIYRRPGAERVS